MGSDENDLHIRQKRLYFCRQFHAVRIRHLDIQKDQIIMKSILGNVIQQIPAACIGRYLCHGPAGLQALPGIFLRQGNCGCLIVTDCYFQHILPPLRLRLSYIIGDRIRLCNGITTFGPKTPRGTAKREPYF